MLTGRGDGRFDVSWSGAAGENPVDLAIADLDEDGLADLAVANHETDYVTLLLGTAGGGFERRDHSQFHVDISPHPLAVRLQDIDSDGHADLLVDDRSPQSIRLFRGLGDGTFAAGDDDRCRRYGWPGRCDPHAGRHRDRTCLFARSARSFPPPHSRAVPFSR